MGARLYCILLIIAAWMLLSEPQARSGEPVRHVIVALAKLPSNLIGTIEAYGLQLQPAKH